MYFYGIKCVTLGNEVRLLTILLFCYKISIEKGMHMSKFDPKNYYFMCYTNPAPKVPEDAEPCFAITPKHLWDNQQRLNCEEDEELNSFLASYYFFELSSSQFEHAMWNPKTKTKTVLDAEKGKNTLKQLGFEENINL